MCVSVCVCWMYINPPWRLLCWVWRVFCVLCECWTFVQYYETHNTPSNTLEHDGIPFGVCQEWYAAVLQYTQHLLSVLHTTPSTTLSLTHCNAMEFSAPSAGSSALLYSIYCPWVVEHVTCGGPEERPLRCQTVASSSVRVAQAYILYVIHKLWSGPWVCCFKDKHTSSMLIAIKRLRTRSAAVRHWRAFGLKRLRTRSCHEWESLVSKFRS